MIARVVLVLVAAAAALFGFALLLSGSGLDPAVWVAGLFFIGLGWFIIYVAVWLPLMGKGHGSDNTLVWYDSHGDSHGDGGTHGGSDGGGGDSVS